MSNAKAGIKHWQVESLDRAAVFLLKLATCSLFLGRGYLYLSDRGPLSTFFWHEGWLAGLVESWLAVDWYDYASHSDSLIRVAHRAIGILFVICGLLSWKVSLRKSTVINGIVLAGTLCLLPHWMLEWVGKDYQIPMFLELFLQWGTPLLLLLYARLKPAFWLILAACFVSFTFVGHGFYAIGLWVPHSNDFVNMTMSLLGLGHDAARIFLHLVGWVDLALPLLFLLPQTRLAAFAYAALWGIVTALSRIPSHWTPYENYYGMDPWLAEAVVRLTHGLVPLALLVVCVTVARQRSEQKNEALNRESVSCP